MNTTRNEEADVGVIIRGIFFLLPFLRTMKYNPLHHYKIVPLNPNSPNQVNENMPNDKLSGSKAEKLRELKGLLDDQKHHRGGIWKGRQKILNEKS